MFANTEYYEMILCVGAAGGNCRRGRELYRQRFVESRPLGEQRRLPSNKCFRNMNIRLQSTGSFERSRNNGRPSVRNGSTLEQQILDHFREHPESSTRRVGAQNTNHTTIRRTLRDEGLHPYHVSRTQELLPTDCVQRIHFCSWYKNRALAVAAFAGQVLWSDEATFTRNGVWNIHNGHVWAAENPHAFRQSKFQHQWRINVWAGIVGDSVIGPIWLPSRLNSREYLRVLREDVENIIEDFPISTYCRLIFQHDGAPAHYARPVRTYLDRRYEEWIGRGGTVPWPARSPDLTPLDFFLRGYIKNSVYVSESSSTEELKTKLQQRSRL